MEEKIDEIENLIVNEEMLEESMFNIEVIENSNAKIMNLINNNEEFEYELKNKYYNFKFTEGIFIKKVRFYAVNGIDLKGLEIVSIDANDDLKKIEFSRGNNAWVPNKVIKSFKLKAPKRLVDKIKLSKVELLGFRLEDFKEISQKIEKLEIYENTLNELLNEIKNQNSLLKIKELEVGSRIEQKEIEHSNKLEELENEIEKNQSTLLELETNIEELNNSTIPTLENKKEILISETNNLEEKKESLSSENKSISNNIKQLEQTSDTLNSKISKEKDKLQELIDDKNLFATEIGEYTKQGNDDIKLYTRLSLIPWFVIVIVSAIVFWGTSDLTTIYSLVKEGELKDISIETIFWSRIPFTLIVISILFVSYEVSKMFIQNIIHIQKQKRIFMKIGIIAKDVADQSVLGLDLNDREKFELRTKLKMDLLKSHLKNEIGEEYKDKINTSLLDYYKEFKKKREEKFKEKNKLKEENTSELNSEN